jgi:hypothetical protein
MFRNAVAGLWFLRLRGGAATSLHCHPHKKTGLVLLSGEAQLSFLNSSERLAPMSRAIIRPGLFHSTKALSPEGIAMLEIETPPDKANLVRLEDSYGREAKPYEGEEAMAPLPEDCLIFPSVEDDRPQTFHLEGCTLTLLKTQNLGKLDLSNSNQVLIVLDGGLCSNETEPVLSAGDVVSPGTLARLAKSFPAPNGIKFVSVSRP